MNITLSMRNAECGTRSGHPLFRTPHSTLRIGYGQSSFEMTVAMFGALLLLFGSLKIFLWLGERLVMREQAYLSSRWDNPGPWKDPADMPKLKVFSGE